MSNPIETITCPECRRKFRTEATIGMPDDQEVTCSKCNFRFTLGESRGEFYFSDKLKSEAAKLIIKELVNIRKELERQEYRPSVATVLFGILVVLGIAGALAVGNKWDLALVGIFAIALRPFFMK